MVVRLSCSAERRRTHGHRRGSIGDRGAHRRDRAPRASPKHSYGFGRAQLVAALVNGLFMLAVVATIIVQAVSRFANPPAVHGETVTAVALVGLLLNIVVAWMLSHGEHGIGWSLTSCERRSSLGVLSAMQKSMCE